MNPKMMSILVVLVAGMLLGNAAASSVTVEDFEAEYESLESMVKSGVASYLASSLWLICRNKETPISPESDVAFSQKLADKNSEEYKCAVSELEKGEFTLDAVIKAADPDAGRFEDIEYYNRIRDHTFGGHGQENIQKFADIAMQKCKAAITTAQDFFDRALEAKVVDKSENVARGYRQLSACKLLVEYGISKESMAKLGHYAVHRSKYVKGLKHQDVKRMKADYHEKKNRVYLDRPGRHTGV